MQLKLKRFDMSQLGDDSNVVLLGKKNTGKSFLVRDILGQNKDIPVGTVISPTEASNKFYSTLVPSLFIHHEYTPELLNSVVSRQKLIMKRMNKEIRVRGGSSIDPRAFLVLDDCMYDKSWVNDVNIRFLFMNGRHVRMLMLITMQTPLGITPNLRTNIDYVFILRENLISNREKIYKHYAGMFPSFDVFSQVLNQTTENYECLVIANNSKSNRLDDQVFWYKAENRPPYKMGSPEFWRYHDEMCDVDSDDEDAGEDMLDVTSFSKHKRGPCISVKKHLF